MKSIVIFVYLLFFAGLNSANGSESANDCHISEKEFGNLYSDISKTFLSDEESYSVIFQTKQHGMTVHFEVAFMESSARDRPSDALISALAWSFEEAGGDAAFIPKQGKGTAPAISALMDRLDTNLEICLAKAAPETSFKSVRLVEVFR